MNDDKRFDEALSDELSTLPLPQEVARSVTPWRTAADRIAAGLVLSTFSTNLLWLQYILPTVGAMLLYLGFRTLRKNNGFFTACYALTIPRVLLALYALLAAATPLELTGEPTVLTWLGLAAELALLLLYRFAVRRAFADIGEKPKKDPLLRAFIWYLAAALIALSPYNQSWLPFIVMIVFYVVIIRGLVRLNASLEVWGYEARAAPVRIGSGLLWKLYLLLALLLVFGGMLVSNCVRPDAAPVENTPDTAQETRSTLLSLGFPETVLADMADEDVRSLDGAILCSAVDDSIEFYGTALFQTEQTLRVITVYTEKPGGEMRVTAWFRWEDAPNSFWQDAVQLYGEPGEENGIRAAEAPAGRLLYEKGGVTYSAPLPDLTLTADEVLDFFGSRHLYANTTARVGYPSGAENQRGYIMQTIRYDEESVSLLWMDFRYYHQYTPLVLPYRDSRERLIGGAFGASLVGEARQSYTTQETSRVLNGTFFQ